MTSSHFHSQRIARIHVRHTPSLNETYSRRHNAQFEFGPTWRFARSRFDANGSDVRYNVRKTKNALYKVRQALFHDAFNESNPTTKLDLLHCLLEFFNEDESQTARVRLECVMKTCKGDLSRCIEELRDCKNCIEELRLCKEDAGRLHQRQPSRSTRQPSPPASEEPSEQLNCDVSSEFLPNEDDRGSSSDFVSDVSEYIRDDEDKVAEAARAVDDYEVLDHDAKVWKAHGQGVLYVNDVDAEREMHKLRQGVIDIDSNRQSQKSVRTHRNRHRLSSAPSRSTKNATHDGYKPHGCNHWRQRETSGEQSTSRPVPGVRPAIQRGAALNVLPQLIPSVTPHNTTVPSPVRPCGTASHPPVANGTIM